MTKHSDSELIAAIRNDDLQAFEQLHERYWAVLHRLAYKRIGDAEDTGDLLQELFIELWETRQMLVFNNAPENWLRNRLWFKIAHYFRTKGTTEKHRQNFIAFVQQQHAVDQSISADQLRDAEEYYVEILDMLNQAVAGMPDRMREIFILNKTEQMTVKEIAEELEVSPKTVKAQLERAMQRLRKEAGEHRASAMELVIAWWLLNL